MEYPQILLPILEELYRFGKQICTEVENFQPDLVIGLAHSGWMPVTVARTLWSDTRKKAFPPALRTNIGQEKHTIYKERFKPSMPAYCCGECCSGSDDRLGHYLAWIADQESWQYALHNQVQSVHREDPERIMVVDDLFGGYRTCFIALGLLDMLYPRAEACMIAGDKDLTNDFVDAWILQFVPALGGEIAQDSSKKSRARYSSPWHELLKPLITGSEDIVPESLDWQPLHSGSPAVQKLRGIATPDTILAAPAWAASLACRYALGRLRGEIKPTGIPEDYDHFQLRAPLKIEPAERLFRQAWLKNGITRKDIFQAYGSLPGGLAEGLRHVKRFAHAHGHGRGVVYMPDEATDSWVTAYDPPHPSGGDSERLKISGFAEFIPGQLWAGVYPHFEYSLQPGVCLKQLEMCKDLLSRGVHCFLDLTTPVEFHARWPYQEGLKQASQELGLEAEHLHFPLGFRAAPTRPQMSALLQKIGTSLDAGLGVYIHAGHNLEGRVPVVLACLLVDQGYAPPQALSRVTDFWLQTLPYLIRLPLSDRQRQFVMCWKKR